MNPNLNVYCAVDEDIKDNRRLENMYDEIQKRASNTAIARQNGGNGFDTDIKGNSLTSRNVVIKILKKFSRILPVIARNLSMKQINFL